ncbi:MAG: mechanosensitive ion channel [Prevotellaceae bacterium]|nr:mechanosensitive ion channel [Prevotellaceae bacterium]
MTLSLFLLALLAEDGMGKLQTLIQQFITWAVGAGGNIIGAIIIFVVGRVLITFLKKLVARVMSKKKVDASIQGFVKSLVNILLTVLLIVAVVGKLGVETTSFAALLASVGVAVGMAMSGNLQNFAGGLIILLFRPFKVGDFIEGQGVSGTVREIQIFHTILLTPDNKVIYVPNGSLSSGTVVNYSHESIRRVDWVVGVEYGQDLAQVEQTARRVIAADKRVLENPAPFIAVNELSSSSVDIVIRVWVNSADYWDVYFDLRKAIYNGFNEAGIGFPFPQLTLHQAKS